MVLDFVHGQDRIDLTAFHINEKQLDQLLGGRGNDFRSRGGFFDWNGWFGGNLYDELFGDHGNHGGGWGGNAQSPITIQTVGNDTVLSFNGGSIDIVGVRRLQVSDFIV